MSDWKKARELYVHGVGPLSNEKLRSTDDVRRRYDKFLPMHVDFALLIKQGKPHERRIQPSTKPKRQIASTVQNVRAMMSAMSPSSACFAAGGIEQAIGNLRIAAATSASATERYAAEGPEAYEPRVTRRLTPNEDHDYRLIS